MSKQAAWDADRRWDCAPAAGPRGGSLGAQSLVGASAFGQLAGGGGGGIGACGSCDSIAESARALALGTPASSKKAADQEYLALPVPPPSSRSSSRLSAHGHWAAPPPEPPPAPGLFATLRGALGGGGPSTSASNAEREPLMSDDTEAGAPSSSSSWEASSWEASFASLKARVAPPPPPKPGPCDCVCRRLPALTYQQRLFGFLACLAIGLLLSLTSLMSFGSLLTGNPTPFALKYTIGNLLSMGASGFLVGFTKQCRDMFAPVRRVASVLYVASLGTTLVCIFYLRSRLLTTVSICVQLGAMVWYCVSYLPFGQNMLRRMCGWWCRL